MRLALRVRPGASRTRVGGCYSPTADDRQLVVAVTAPAVDGRATKAVLAAVADALGVRAREVGLISGATSRTKVVEVPDACAAQVRELLGG